MSVERIRDMLSRRKGWIFRDDADKRILLKEIDRLCKRLEPIESVWEKHKNTIANQSLTDDLNILNDFQHAIYKAMEEK